MPNINLTDTHSHTGNAQRSRTWGCREHGADLRYHCYAWLEMQWVERQGWKTMMAKSGCMHLINVHTCWSIYHAHLLLDCCWLLLYSLWSNGIQGKQLSSLWQHFEMTLWAAIFVCVSLTEPLHAGLHLGALLRVWQICQALPVFHEWRNNLNIAR